MYQAQMKMLNHQVTCRMRATENNNINKTAATYRSLANPWPVFNRTAFEFSHAGQPGTKWLTSVKALKSPPIRYKPKTDPERYSDIQTIPTTVTARCHHKEAVQTPSRRTIGTTSVPVEKLQRASLPGHMPATITAKVSSYPIRRVQAYGTHEQRRNGGHEKNAAQVSGTHLSI